MHQIVIHLFILAALYFCLSAAYNTPTAGEGPIGGVFNLPTNRNIVQTK
jgi:hypothetical protein